MYREMRRKEKSMTPREAEELLRRASVGRLGLSLDDNPYVVPVNYVYHEGNIYFHSAREGQKVDYLTKNSKACFEVDEFLGLKEAERPCEYGARYRSVIVYGRVRIVDDRDEKMEALEMLVRKYVGGEPRARMDVALVDRVLVGEMVVDRVTGKQTL